MKILHGIAFGLVVIGSLNWLLIGINSDWNIVAQLFGTTAVANTVYILVGLSAIYLVATHKKDCKMCQCGKDKPSAAPTA